MCIAPEVWRSGRDNGDASVNSNGSENSAG